MLSVGEKLRRARLEQGREIADLAASTKISARFLEAIESDRRDQIPAGFFYRNWALQYAHALSVDEKEILDGIDRVLSTEAPLPLPGEVHAASKELPRVNRNIYRRDGVPRMLVSVSLLVLVVVGCSGFYAWWHKQQQERQNIAMTGPTETTPSAPRRATSACEANSPASQPNNTDVASAAPVPSASDALLVELHAREQTWLAISPDGRQIFSGVMEANESKTVEAHESARIKIGNAGGVDVRFNGKPLGEIGPKGKVRVLLVSPNGVRIMESHGPALDSPVALSDRSATLALAFQQ